MSLQRLNLGSLLYVPQFEGAIGTATHQQMPLGMKADTDYRTGMPIQGLKALSALQVP